MCTTRIFALFKVGDSILTRIRNDRVVTTTTPWQSQYQWGPPGYETSPTIGTINAYGVGECTDEVHKYPYHSGGPLTIRKRECTVIPSQAMKLQSGYLRFRGHLYCNPSWPRDPSIPSQAWYDANFASPDSFGAEAWNKYRPGKPDASLGQFLGELREAPRLLKFKVKSFKERGYHGRDFGSDYLNIQFGWLPVVRDIQSFYRAFKNLETRLEQLKRDNGRPIRRRGTIKMSEDTTFYEEGYAYSHAWPSLTSGFYNQTLPHRQRNTTWSEKVWFSGRFRYWIPDIGTPQWERRAIIALFGANLSPSLAYELMPWSWLIDWFVNIGDVIENMSANAAENLTADYAYTMLHSEYRHDRWMRGNFRAEGGGWQFASATERNAVILKSRVHASPFGFGMNEDDLNPRQLGILSALGLTMT